MTFSPFAVLSITFSPVTVFPGTFAQLSVYQLPFYQRLGFYWFTLRLLQPAGRPSGTETLFRAGSSSVISCSRVVAAPPRCPPPGARVRCGQPRPVALASLLFPQAATDNFFSRRSRVSSCSSFFSPFVVAVLSLSLPQQLPFTRTIRNYNGSVNYAIALVLILSSSLENRRCGVSVDIGGCTQSTHCGSTYPRFWGLVHVRFWSLRDL